jgi:hypothetical protein
MMTINLINSLSGEKERTHIQFYNALTGCVAKRTRQEELLVKDFFCKQAP